MKLCIIGNSHVSSLRLATEQQAYGDLEIDFYAVPGGGGPWFHFKDERMFAYIPPERKLFTTIAGAERVGVDISTYDMLLFSAVGRYPAANNSLENVTHHPLSLVACPHWYAKGGTAVRDGEANAPTLVSSAVFETVVEAYVRRAQTVQSAIGVAERFKGRFLWQEIPPPSFVVRDDPSWKINEWYGDRAATVWNEFYTLQKASLHLVAGELRPRVTVLDTPVPVENGFMSDAFGTYDHWHGNAQYGDLVMKSLLAAVESTEALAG